MEGNSRVGAELLISNTTHKLPHSLERASEDKLCHSIAITQCPQRYQINSHQHPHFMEKRNSKQTSFFWHLLKAIPLAYPSKFLQVIYNIKTSSHVKKMLYFSLRVCNMERVFCKRRKNHNIFLHPEKNES